MTTNNLSAAAAKNELHELAEERLRDQKPSANATQSLNEMQHLLDELQARQSELERQNAALQAAAETGQRFTELYELAPVAYFSIDPDSTIRLLNGAGARLLAIDRTQLSAQRLAAHIANDSLPDFNTFLHRAFSSGNNESCELRLIAQGDVPGVDVRIDVHLDAVCDKQLSICNLSITDISARKLVERQLRESTEDLNRAQASAHIGSWRLIAQSNELLWSKETYRIFGLPQDTSVTYDIFLQHVHPEDRIFVDQQWAAALRGEAYAIDHRIMIDEQVKWVREQATLEFDAQGVLLGGFGTVQDITERKQLQDAIRRRDIYRHAILDNIPCLAWLKDEQSHYLEVNSPFARAFGWPSPEAMIGKNDLDIVSTKTAHSFRTDDRWVMENGRSKCTEELIETQAGLRWFETCKSPVVFDGRNIGTVGFSRDISEVREITEHLRESEAFNISILNSLTAHIVVLDENGKIVATNRAWENFVRTEYGLDLAAHAGDLHFCNACGLASEQPCHQAHCDLWDAIETVLLGHRSAVSLDYQSKLMAQARWFRMSAHALPAPRRGAVVAHEDITELMQAVEQQKAAKAEAEHANYAKSRFLAAASHDLRQPLFALTLYIGMLKSRLGPADATLHDNLSSCVSSLNELLTDLLDISKLDAGVVTPETRDFPVSELFDHLIPIHAPEALLKGLKLRARATPINASTDPVLLRRIVGNLIANAVRYTEHGGVLVCCRRYQGKTWIEVRDTGIGIPAENTTEIFEEFRQLSRQLGPSDSNRGSGLGLAIVAKAAALLGLEIRLRSRLGKGSMFAVEIPLGQASRIEARRKLKTRPLRIGLVDDNRHILKAISCALEANGHQVVAATTSKELLALFAEKPAPDVVISDFRLGGGETGFDVLSAARSHFGEKLPALLITGDTDPKLLRSMADRGIMVQHKPLEIDTLEACIADLTNRRSTGKTGQNNTQPSA